MFIFLKKRIQEINRKLVLIDTNEKSNLNLDYIDILFLIKNSLFMLL